MSARTRERGEKSVGSRRKWGDVVTRGLDAAGELALSSRPVQLCSESHVQGTPSDLSSSSVNVKVSEAVCSEEIVIRLE